MKKAISKIERNPELVYTVVVVSVLLAIILHNAVAYGTYSSPW